MSEFKRGDIFGIISEKKALGVCISENYCYIVNPITYRVNLTFDKLPASEIPEDSFKIPNLNDYRSPAFETKTMVLAIKLGLFS